MTTPTPSGRFEERLLHQLTHVVGQNPNPHVAPAPAATPPRARRARLALAGTVLAGVAAATVVLATSTGGTSDAFAVAPQANGTVSVTVNDLSDASGLEQKLRAVGIPAVVSYSADPIVCTSNTRTPAPPGTVIHTHGPTLVTGGEPGPAGSVPPAPGGAVGGMRVLIHRKGDTTSATFTLNPDDFTAGRKLVVTAGGDAVSSLGIQVANGPGTPAPGCIPAP